MKPTHCSTTPERPPNKPTPETVQIRATRPRARPRKPSPNRPVVQKPTRNHRPRTATGRKSFPVLSFLNRPGKRVPRVLNLYTLTTRFPGRPQIAGRRQIFVLVRPGLFPLAWFPCPPSTLRGTLFQTIGFFVSHMEVICFGVTKPWFVTSVL